MKKEYVIVVMPYKDYYKCEIGGHLQTSKSLQHAFITDDIAFIEQVCDHLNKTYDDAFCEIKTLN